MQLGLGDALAVFDFALNKCDWLHRMVVNLTDNKERSEQLSQSVKALQNLILIIKQSGHIYEPIVNALHKLETSLVHAEFLLSKYSQAKGIKKLAKSNGFESKFQGMNQRLNENCFMLALILLAEQRAFLHRVYQMVIEGMMDQEPSWSSPTSPPVSVLVPRPLKNSDRLPFPSLLPPVQHHTAPGRVVALPSYLVSPRYASNFTTPSPSPFVSPASPIHAISARAVLSSTLSPPSIPLQRTYGVGGPLFP